MKYNNFFLLLLLAVSFLTSSCRDELFGVSGSGPIISEKRSVNNFENVELDIAAKVEITKDSIFSVDVLDYENILSHIVTEVKGNTMIIRYDPKNLSVTNSATKIKITMPALNGMSVNGSGNISLLSGFPDLETINIPGSGEVSALESFETTTLSIVISGSGDVTASGNGDQLNVNISGSGNIHCYDFVAQNATCINSGSGNAFINVVQNLNATISGSGNITYLGNPKLILNISGSGKITSR